MNRNGTLHALLSTARVANIPSVVSNVWVGVVLGVIHDLTGESDFPWAGAGWLALAGVLLYIGGNFFNDWMDRAWDASHRPERALPRGLFPPALYLGLAVCLTGAGTGLAWAGHARSGMVAGGIVFFIVIYTVWHKRTPWAVIPMGLCRALLPVMGFVAFYPYVNDVWPIALALLFYIAGLSLSARYEAMAEPPKWVGWTGRGLLLGAAVLAAYSNKEMYVSQFWGVVCTLPYLAWTDCCLRFWGNPVPKLVSRLLAGIPLVEWMVLLPLAVMAFQNPGAAPQFFALACFLVPPLAFVSALLLQRVAPAT
ncbi:MAG: UbiA family prenyltransferase [Verrucomicrobiota bacterium]